MTLDFLRPLRAKKIRAGRRKDGGYVLEATSLQDIDVIYSYGAGWDISFEKALVKMAKKTCRVFDPTIDVTTFSKHGYIKNKGTYYLLKYFVATALWKPYVFFNRILGYDIKFYSEGLGIRKEGKYDSFTNHIIRFKDQGKNIFLKIDIDGGEYEIFTPDLISSLNYVSQLAIEFHNVKERISDLKKIIESINDKLSLVHIHGNNWQPTFNVAGKQVPIVLELTFVANKYLAEKEFDTADYPIEELDFPNNLSLPEIDLSQLTGHF